MLGLGDVYLGAPVATPVDPRHRLVTTKYNPARTWTPENAVGIGVLTCARPGDPSSWRVEQWPVRTNTDSAVADGFIRERFSPDMQDGIRRFLDMHGWPDMKEPDDGL